MSKPRPGPPEWCPSCGSALPPPYDVTDMDQATKDLSNRIAGGIVSAGLGVPAYQLADATVRGAALVILACANAGDRAAALRLGAAFLNALAEIEGEGSVH